MVKFQDFYQKRGFEPYIIFVLLWVEIKGKNIFPGFDIFNVQNLINNIPVGRSQIWMTRFYSIYITGKHHSDKNHIRQEHQMLLHTNLKYFCSASCRAEAF